MKPNDLDRRILKLQKRLAANSPLNIGYALLSFLHGIFNQRKRPKLDSWSIIHEKLVEEKPTVHQKKL